LVATGATLDGGCTHGPPRAFAASALSCDLVGIAIVGIYPISGALSRFVGPALRRQWEAIRVRAQLPKDLRDRVEITVRQRLGCESHLIERARRLLRDGSARVGDHGEHHPPV